MIPRRNIVASAAGFVTGYGGMAALSDDRDAHLLDLLERFNDLERRHQAIIRAVGLDFAADSAAEPMIAALEGTKGRLAPMIIASPTHTLAGLKARAASLVLWAPDLLEAQSKDCLADQFTGAILRGILALPD